MSEALRASNLVKVFSIGDQPVTVLNGLNLSLASGEQLVVLGASGEGKSTLLQVLSGLRTVDSGQVWIGGSELGALNDDQRTLMRNQRLGFMYQFHYLLSELTALENAALPLGLRAVSQAAAREQAETMLRQLGMGERLHHRPQALSGGERQRVALARALIGDPQLLLLDEPTGNLDRARAQEVREWIGRLCRERNVACIVATHDTEFGEEADRVLRMLDGQLRPG